MAQVKVSQNLKTFLKGLKASPKALKDSELFWLDRIQRFTWSGRSLVTGGRFKPLSGPYRKWRKKVLAKQTPWSQTNAVGEFFAPNKSNLTLTGQLINSLKGRSNFRKQGITIIPTGTRKDGKTNKEVAEEVAKKGRPFLGLDEKGKQRIIQIVKRDLRRQLKRRRR